MGIQTTLGTPVDQDRKTATLGDAMRHYSIVLGENSRENILHGHCPLPMHKRGGGKSFRVRIDPTTGKMLRWQCLSKSCLGARRSGGSDLAAFVAAMEGVTSEEAAMMIRGGLLDGARAPLEVQRQTDW